MPTTVKDTKHIVEPRRTTVTQAEPEKEVAFDDSDWHVGVRVKFDCFLSESKKKLKLDTQAELGVGVVTGDLLYRQRRGLRLVRHPLLLTRDQVFPRQVLISISHGPDVI